MIQLTDELIRTTFAKTGFDEKYFPVYEGKVKQAYNELQEDLPDDDETTEQESNVFGSIRQANDYIAYYVEEIEKGHSDKWAASIADNRGIEDEFNTKYHFGGIEGLELIDISSTEIRQRIKEGKGIRRMVPKAVADYISKEGQRISLARG